MITQNNNHCLTWHPPNEQKKVLLFLTYEDKKKGHFLFAH